MHPNKKIVVLIKGNPKYYIKGISDKFYLDIEKAVVDAGFIFKYSESTPYTEAPKGLAYILFSRGCGKARFINNIPIAYLGCGGTEKNKQTSKNIWLMSQGDKTSSNDMSNQSLINHWTLTPKNEKLLRDWLNKIK